jgi:hypothetical protein
MAHVPQRGCAMQIVAVRALYEPLVYAMVEGLGELCLRRSVALVAKLRLALRKQSMLFHGMVGQVTVEAANIITGVRGAVEVRLPFAVPMTA